MKTIPELVEQATSVSTPLIAIATADPQATQDAIAKRLENNFGLIAWDIARGIIALNEKGKKAVAALGKDPTELTTPGEALIVAGKLPADTILFFHMAHQYLDNEQVKQATWNLRDLNKANGRCLVMMGPFFTLPAELAQDVLLLDEPLPTESELAEIVITQYENARQTNSPPLTVETFPDPDEKGLARIVDACRGLAAYPSEQTVAMALRKTGIDLDDLWIRKKAIINNVKGLRIIETELTFNDIGGNQTIKEYYQLFAGGRFCPTLFVWIDEIEKLFAGSSGTDTDGGIAKDALATFLTSFVQYKWTGKLLVGHPGTGKSLFAQIVAKTFNAICVNLDTGQTKGSLVSQSEEYIRKAFKTLYSMGGSLVHIIATCNQLDTLRPEMRRRFGTPWYFEICTDIERESIWPICLRQRGLDLNLPRPIDTGWTGAEIDKCCETAQILSLDLLEAAKYIVPITQSDPESIQKLRNQASNRWLSASYPGPYRPETEKAPTGGRKIQL